MNLPSPSRKKRVAIIGSGLAGLCAAHLLTRHDDDIEVHLFEKAQSIGMDSASIDVVGVDGKIHRVDSPMRAVQGGYYTRLLKLYNDLGVQLEESNFTYSFFELSSLRDRQQGGTHSHRHPRRRSSCRTSRGYSNGHANGNGYVALGKRDEPGMTSKRTTFIYNGGNGLSLRPVGFPLNGYNFENVLRHLYIMDLVYHLYGILTTVLKSAFFASCYVYLTLLSFYHVYASHTAFASSHPVARSTLSTFLSTTLLPTSFINEILIPLFACVATCSPEEVMEYPAAEILEYIARTFATDHYIVKGGVRNAVEKLLKKVPSDNIHLGSELVSLRRLPRKHMDGNGEMLELKESSGKIWEFDNVIFATQANQARFLLADYYKALRDSESPLDNAELTLEKERLDALGRFSYTQSIVINHYDSSSSLMDDLPDRRILNIARWNEKDLESTRLSKLQAEEKLDTNKRLRKEYTMATHDLSILHPSCKSPSSGAPLLQTTNPTVELDESAVVSSQVFERAVMTLESKETLKEFLRYPSKTPSAVSDGSKATEKTGKLPFQGLGGIYFVGSWAAEGIPLLEGCVVSAERAVESLRG